jgi:hypothetical protein
MAKKTQRPIANTPFAVTMIQIFMIFIFMPLLFLPLMLNFIFSKDLILSCVIVSFLITRIIIFAYNKSFNYKRFWAMDLFFFILSTICVFASYTHEVALINFSFFIFIVYSHFIATIHEGKPLDGEMNATQKNLQKIIPNLASENRSNERIFIKTMFTKYNNSLPITLEEALKVLEEKNINVFNNGTYKTKTVQGILAILGINNFDSIKRGIDDFEKKTLNNINFETILHYVSIIKKHNNKDKKDLNFKLTNYEKIVKLHKTLQQYQKDSAQIES